MDFSALRTQVIDLLQREGRVAYRALKLQFQPDEDTLEALKDDLIYAKPTVSPPFDSGYIP